MQQIVEEESKKAVKTEVRGYRIRCQIGECGFHHPGGVENLLLHHCQVHKGRMFGVQSSNFSVSEDWITYLSSAKAINTVYEVKQSRPWDRKSSKEMVETVYLSPQIDPVRADERKERGGTERRGTERKEDIEERAMNKKRKFNHHHPHSH